MRDIPGSWSSGTVKGWTYDITWGPGAGYPGVTLDPAGNEIEVDVLESDRLGKFWRTLDDYEGAGYARVPTTVIAGDGTAVTAWIYEARPDAE